MNPNTQENLEKKFVGILNNTPADNPFELSALDRCRDLSISVYNLHKKYMSATDAKGLVFRYIFLLAFPIQDSEADEKGKFLKDFVNTEEETKKFIDYIARFPRLETFYFPLPKIDLNLFREARLGEIGSISCEDLSSISATEVTELGEQRIYFKSTIKGYCGFTTSSTGYNLALIQFKVFVERAISEGLLRIDNLDPTFSSELKSRVQAKYCIEHDDIKGHTITTLDLPMEISDMCSRLILSQNFNYDKEPDEITKEFESKLAYLDKIYESDKRPIQRLRSASEWSFDSLCAERATMQILQLCIGLESIYGDDAGNEGLTEKLSDRCAFSLAETHEEREKIKDEFKGLYKTRSKIVHGVSSQLTEEQLKQLNFGRTLLQRSISKEIKLHCDA